MSVASRPARLPELAAVPRTSKSLYPLYRLVAPRQLLPLRGAEIAHWLLPTVRAAEQLSERRRLVPMGGTSAQVQQAALVLAAGNFRFCH